MSLHLILGDTIMHGTCHALRGRRLAPLLCLWALAAALACSDTSHSAKTSQKPGGPAAAQPKESAPGAQAAAPADWCAGHGLPESKCTKCNPELIPKFKEAGDWCAEHGFPESACPICNPQTPPGQAQAKEGAPGAQAAAPADWCAGHGLPESKCTKCNPELIPKFKEAGDWCAEHGFPESACPICNPQTPPGQAQGASGIIPGTSIRLRSVEIESATGIRTVAAREAALDLGVTSTARIDFNRNRLADVRASVGGIVREVAIDLGHTVAAGSRLFMLESPAVGDLQGQLGAARQAVEIARANYQRQADLGAQKIASARQVELAKSELDAAEAELASLNASLRMTGAAGSKTGRFAVRAPIAGTVVRRPATLGTFATEETSLATIADISTMWALLDIRDLDAASVRVGQSVSITIDGLPEKVFAGTVTWIAAEVDPRTRTVAARAEIDNADGLLRANQFARATIQVAAPEGAVAVPRAAVQRVGEEMAVFVRTGNGLYEPRPVRLGRASGDLVQVSGEVRSGDPVVTEGAFLLKTELSKDQIGAGCCEFDTPGGK